MNDVSIVAVKPEYAIDIDLPDIADGVQAFRRGELPQANWPQAKLDGWNIARMMAAVEVELHRDERMPEEWRVGA